MRWFNIVVFSISFCIAATMFVLQIRNRFAILKRLRPIECDDVPHRLLRVLRVFLGQAKFFKREPQPSIRNRELRAGLMHAVVFWGFLILGPQALTLLVGTYVGHFSPFGHNVLAGVYLLMKDLTQPLVAITVGGFLFRWLITKPTRLFGVGEAEQELRERSHGEALLILCFIECIVLGGLIWDAHSINAATKHLEFERSWQPISALLAPQLGALGAWGEIIGYSGQLLHNLVILLFLNMLPRSKHFHVITSIVNIFAAPLDTAKLIRPDYMATLEAEEEVPLPQLGITHVEHLSVLHGLNVMSCTECGRCSSVCPAAAAGQALAPRNQLLRIRDVLYGNSNELVALPSGFTPDPTNPITPAVVGEQGFLEEALWNCTTCRACEEVCPVDIKYVDMILSMREGIVVGGGSFSPGLRRAFNGMDHQGNPWADGDETKRESWAEGLSIPLFRDNPDAEILFWVGCAGAFDPRINKVVRAFAEILTFAGVSFAILGREERCTGDQARRGGNEPLFQQLARHNVRTLNGYGVRKIVTSCPHCLQTLGREYPDFGGDYEVVHTSQFLEMLMREGKLSLKTNTDGNGEGSVVFHDPCYLGRHNGEYESPREILRRLGAKLNEIPESRSVATCCGAGGANIQQDYPVGKRVNEVRTEQLLRANAETIAVGCPFCTTMITDGVNAKEGNLATPPRVLDLVEIVRSQLTD